MYICADIIVGLCVAVKSAQHEIDAEIGEQHTEKGDNGKKMKK